MKMTRFDIRTIENYSELKAYAKKRGIKFIAKPAREMYGFAGLHQGDGKAWGINIGPKEIQIDKTIKGKYKYEIQRHEIEENALWKQGQPIWKAHITATKHEKYNSKNWKK